MANTFKNAGVLVGATATDIYTVPGSTTAVLHAIWAANLHASDVLTVTIQWYDSSAASTHIIAKAAPIPQGDTLILDKPLNLETGDKLQMLCSSANDVEASLAILEIS